MAYARPIPKVKTKESAFHCLQGKLVNQTLEPHLDTKQLVIYIIYI